MKARAGFSILLAGALAPAAWAQGENEAPTLSEVTVTAQRQAQNIQDVPISMTAFTQEDLEQNGLSEVKDYFMFTPNVSFTEDGENGERSVGISIRGVSDFASSLTNIGALSSSFGIYLDEFNVANSAVRVTNPELKDLQSVEVLRGPQGTFFGRNATGGALNLTTALPSDKMVYEFAGGYGTYGTWNASIMANVPLADNFFVRAVAWQEESDGFIKNLSTTGNDASYKHTNVRGSARWLVNERITADLSLMQTRSDDGADTNVNSGVLDVDTLGATPNDKSQQSDRFDLAEPIPGRRRHHAGAGARARGRAHRAALRAAGGGRLSQLGGGHRRRRRAARRVPEDAHPGRPALQREVLLHARRRPRRLGTATGPAQASGFSVWKTRYATIGVLICWDQWYPEAARITALLGAEVLFYPTAIGWHPAEKDEWGAAQVDAWRTMQRAHAIANGVYVASPNRVGHEDEPGTDGIDVLRPLVHRRSVRPRARRGGRATKTILIAPCDPALIESVAAQLAVPARPPHRRLRRRS